MKRLLLILFLAFLAGSCFDTNVNQDQDVRPPWEEEEDEDEPS